MKRAVIIVYDGKTPPLQAQKNSVEILAQYGIIDDLEHVEVYTLDEAEIVAAIAAKAITIDAECTTNKTTLFEKPEIWAAKMIFGDFEESLKSKDYDTFSAALSIRLSSELLRVPETKFIKAVRILTRDNAENNLDDSMKEFFDNRIFNIMRRSFYLVCQGRHIVFQ